MQREKIGRRQEAAEKQAGARRKAGWRLLRSATQPEPIFTVAEILR